MLQVDLLLSCSEIITVPVESVLKLPKVGDEIKCANCHKISKIIKVGTPYREGNTEKFVPDKDQQVLK